MKALTSLALFGLLITVTPSFAQVSTNGTNIITVTTNIFPPNIVPPGTGSTNVNTGTGGTNGNTGTGGTNVVITPPGPGTGDTNVNNGGTGDTNVNTGGTGGDTGGTDVNPGGGTDDGSGSPAPAARLSAADRLLLRQSAQSALLEISLGELAVSTSQDSSIQAFGQRMIDEHTAQLQELEALASQFGTTATGNMSARNRSIVRRLSRVNAARFDRTWIRTMVTSHKQALALHERAAERGRNDSVRSYARNQLGTIAAHLTSALELREQFP